MLAADSNSEGRLYGFLFTADRVRLIRHPIREFQRDAPVVEPNLRSLERLGFRFGHHWRQQEPHQAITSSHNRANNCNFTCVGWSTWC